MLRHHSQMDDGHDRTDNATDPDLVHSTAAHGRGFVINKSDTDSCFFHQAGKREVVIAAVEVDRGVAKHDWTAPLDLGKRGSVGFSGLADFKFEIDLTLPINFFDQIR